MVGQLILNPLIAMASVSQRVKGADTILENDPQGVIVALISISVVLAALVVLALVIFGFSRIMIVISKRTALETIEKNTSSKAAAPLKPGEASGEVIAAISVALKLNKEALHDRESEVITINKVARVYSPWSSKLHGLTNMPR